MEKQKVDDQKNQNTDSKKTATGYERQVYFSLSSPKPQPEEQEQQEEVTFNGPFCSKRIDF